MFVVILGKLKKGEQGLLSSAFNKLTLYELALILLNAIARLEY
jgi:hypothetical protein